MVSPASSARAERARRIALPGSPAWIAESPSSAHRLRVGEQMFDVRSDSRSQHMPVLPVEASPWFEQLNVEQRTAVRHPGGPLLILAGAGTGKTTTLCGRVAWLVAEGVAPERILLLTFTRRAAREMLQRARALVAMTHGARGGLG